MRKHVAIWWLFSHRGASIFPRLGSTEVFSYLLVLMKGHKAQVLILIAVMADFFEGTYDSRLSIVIGIVTNFASITVALVLLIGILWFERFGSDAKRTIFDKIVSLMCWNGILWIFLAQLPELKRYSVGPMSENFCHFHLFIKNTLSIHMNLLVSTAVVVRHMFIFKLKNPYKFCDDFWTRFINLWIVTFALTSQAVFEIRNGREPLNFYLCSGTKPESQKANKLNLTYYGCTLLSLSVQVIVYIRGLYCRWKSKNRINIDQGLVVHHVNQSLAEQSLMLMHTSFSSIFAGLLIICTQIDPIQLNYYPNYFYIYCVHLYVPSLCFIMLTLSIYCLHKKLQKVVLAEIKECFDYFFQNLVFCSVFNFARDVS